MLTHSDVLSLIVALYTIKLARSPSSSANSYGWQRAEILGALINGVFLVALCMSIALEALGRVISPPEISNPKIIVIVGSLGLLSNTVGLFLFHGMLIVSRFSGLS
jgi:zinc transporter 1